MKWVLRYSLLVAFMFSAFAANINLAFADNLGNPFNDVPAHHWAYSSIEKLIQAGVIDGEGDKSFNGDKTITRYEMAQMVAKAMTKYSGADNGSKVEIDKLKVEFADELKALGIRLQAVEDKVNNETEIHGVIKTFYDYNKQGVYNGIPVNGAPSTNNTLPASTSSIKQDARFSFDGKIDDNLSYSLWYLYAPSQDGLPGGYDNFRCADSPEVGSLGAAVEVKHFFLPNTSAILGHTWILPIDDNWVYSDGVKGVILSSKVGAINVRAEYGTLDVYGAIDSGAALTNTAKIINATTSIGHTDLGAAYWDIQNGDGTEKKITEGQIKQHLSTDLLLNINAGKGNHDATIDSDSGVSAEYNFYDIKLGYKGTDSRKVGSSGIYIDYHSIGENAVIDPDEVNAMPTGTGYKGFRIGFDTVVYKNVTWRSYVLPQNQLISNNSVKDNIFRTAIFLEY